jgi:hypothetical protein
MILSSKIDRRVIDHRGIGRATSAIASAYCMAEPCPIPRAGDNKERIAAQVVIAIGRIRLVPVVMKRACRSSVSASSRNPEQLEIAISVMTDGHSHAHA